MINLSPSEIISSWDAGAIDGGFCWGDTFQYMAARGTTVVLSGQLSAWGKSTFLILGVRADFAAKHPAFVRRSVGAQPARRLVDRRRQRGGRWGAADPAGLAASIAHLFGLNHSDATERAPCPLISSLGTFYSAADHAAPFNRTGCLTPPSPPRRCRPPTSSSTKQLTELMPSGASAPSYTSVLEWMTAEPVAPEYIAEATEPSYVACTT